MPREYREERLARVLREQLHENIKGVQETVIVTNDGLVVAAYPGASQEQNTHDDVGSSRWVAALAAEIIAQSRRAFGRLAQGAVSRILVEGESGSMIVVPAGDHAALAVIVEPHTKLGLAMFQITRVAEHISNLLD
jgi:predicted regulator of Ras-like GTPase activity (Roadblock/LC7/MglB family)